MTFFMMNAKIQIIIMVVVVLLTGCGGSNHSKSTVSKKNDVKDARVTIDQFIKNAGLMFKNDSTPPKDINELLEIIKSDNVSRYKAAQKYASTLNGADGLYIRSMLDLSWAGIQQITAKVLKERANKKLAESNRLDAMEKSGAELSDEESAKKADLEARAEKLVIVSHALQTVMDVNITSGESLANEMVRQFPENPGGFVLRAYANRLKGAWSVFTGAIKTAERLEKKENQNIRYQRIMEKLQRFRLKNEARTELEAFRDELPDWVRAQAILTAIADSTESSHKELERLRAVSPHHIVVQLLGKIIDDEYAVYKSLNPQSQVDTGLDSEQPAQADTDTSLDSEADTATDSSSEN